MRTPEPTDVKQEELITASEVARLAGVKPSAVSNWRKRFEDSFPRPAGSAPGGGDLFRKVEVTKWLLQRDRPGEPGPPASQQLWAIADRLRGTATAGSVPSLVATAAAFVHLSRRQGGQHADVTQTAPGELAELVAKATSELEDEDPVLRGLFEPLAALEPADLQFLLAAANALAQAGELAHAVDATLDKGLRYGESHRTSEAATDLLMRVARPRGVVFDPAAGSGEFLIRTIEANPDAKVFGQEVNTDAWRIGASRLILRDIPPRIARGDSLFADAYEELRADVVLCDPPVGARLSDRDPLPGDPRWRLLGSLEAPRPADFAWLAHAVHHLQDGGRGYVLLTQGSLFRGGAEARFRSELLRKGVIESVVTLPAVAAGSNAASSLWIVRPATPVPEDVLFIDGRGDDGALTSMLIDKISDLLHAWRDNRATFSPIPGFATTVPVLELLSGDASLLPSRWVSEPELLDVERVLNTVREKGEHISRARTLLPREPRIPDVRAAGQTPERFRVAELIDHGLATLLLPARLKEKDFAKEGISVWTPADVRPSWQRENERRFANPDSVAPKSITQPGDIVLTTVGDLRARVDTEGGHVLGTSLHGLRLEPGMFDPEAVAPLLTSSRNRRMMGGTIPRVKLRELEFPSLDAEGARRLRDALDALDAEERAGRAIARGAEELREALVDAVAAGVAVVEESTAGPSPADTGTEGEPKDAS